MAYVQDMTQKYVVMRFLCDKGIQGGYFAPVPLGTGNAAADLPLST